MKIDIKEFTLEELKNFIESMGEPPYRATQLYDWIYKKNVHDFTKMLNISKSAREKFSEKFFIKSDYKIDEFRGSDGTIKFRFTLNDGSIVESVYIPETTRTTLCVSTQVGCPLGCKFCLTGVLGFRRNLNVSEMVGEVLEVRNRIGSDAKITNIVLMGMGEPLLNYDNVLKFIKILTEPHGFAFAKRKVTLSTSGILPELEKFINDADISLSISLNAPDNDTRTRIMPINKKFPIRDILDVAGKYPKVHKRMVTFEYVLIKDINDSESQAEELAKLLKGIRCKINLIPYNENPYSEFKRPPDERILRFQQILMKHNYTATVRKSRGQDISAACGQLGVLTNTSQSQGRS